MNEIEQSEGHVYQDLDLDDAGDMLSKSEYVMKLAAVIESGHVSKADLAQRLGLNLQSLEEILHGRFRDIPVSVIAGYLNKLSE
ncbi:XRE family transcriptional regulator [Pseudomonas sp. NPDC087346]|uniref:XRE family transcriptional regulator n=1 Tax=Pseudomonas sp. NPDC087346 TaxID=3364438 RepID=UPI00380543FE